MIIFFLNTNYLINFFIFKFIKHKIIYYVKRLENIRKLSLTLQIHCI